VLIRYPPASIAKHFHLSLSFCSYAIEMKKNINTKARIALIGFLLMSIIAPGFGYQSSYNVKKVFSSHHSNFSITAAQELEEDGTEDSIDSDYQLYFTQQLETVQAGVFPSSLVKQQVDSFFFVQLFSNISTQAP
jgi:hypothetical protein